MRKSENTEQRNHVHKFLHDSETKIVHSAVQMAMKNKSNKGQGKYILFCMLGNMYILHCYLL